MQTIFHFQAFIQKTTIRKVLSASKYCHQTYVLVFYSGLFFKKIPHIRYFQHQSTVIKLMCFVGWKHSKVPYVRYFQHGSTVIKCMCFVGLKHSKVPYVRLFSACQPNKAYAFDDSTLMLKLPCKPYFIFKHLFKKLPYVRYFQPQSTVIKLMCLCSTQDFFSKKYRT